MLTLDDGGRTPDRWRTVCVCISLQGRDLYPFSGMSFRQYELC